MDAKRGRIAAAILVAMGVFVRAGLFAVQPTPMLWYDTGTYMFQSLPDVAPAADRPLGYSWFLRGLRILSAELWPIQATQMVLGVGAALCLFGVARRLIPEPRWVSLGVLGVCLFWPTNLLLESYALSESLFLFVVALGAFLLVRSVERRSLAGLALAGLVTGAAALVRLPGVYFCAVFGLCSWLVRAPGDAGRWSLARLARPATFGVPCALVLLGYMRHYERHHGVWALESWAGVNRYCLMAPLIEPDLAEPDARSVAFLRAHADGHRGHFAEVMWSARSPITLAPTELGLDAPALDRWAGTLAFRAAARNPLAAARIFAHNVVLAFTVIDPLDRQIEMKPQLGASQATLSIYGVDTSTWHTTHAFRGPSWLRALLAWRPLLFAALFVSLFFTAIPRLQHEHQRFVALPALGFVLVVAASILPEQRHVHVAENLAIVNLLLLGGQIQRARAAG